MKKGLCVFLVLTLALTALCFPALAQEEGKVLNIWCWNDEFQSRFNDFYPEVKEIAEDKSTTTLNDGTLVKWTINPNTNNNYQDKLDAALLAQENAPADEKIDIFLIEADYALKYVDSPYTLDVRADIGLTDEDLADQYAYTQEIASADGVLKGVTWQATPGLFAYRRSIAKDVLGTDDPDEVQAQLSDWDKFDAVAAKASEKGYKMLSGFDDSFRTFSKTFDRILALKPENITVHTFCVKKASDILRQDADVYSLRGGDAGKCVDYTQLQAQQEGYKPYYMYRQKNTVGNYENVGFALEGAECRYNIYMMEEVHSIFAAGAGAVSKLVDYRPERGGKPMIERLFYPKYPYEYLRDESTAAKLAQMEEFYRMHGLLE